MAVISEDEYHQSAEYKEFLKIIDELKEELSARIKEKPTTASKLRKEYADRAAKEAKENFVGWIEKQMAAWKETQFKLISKKLKALVPTTNYYVTGLNNFCFVELSPQQGQQQAEIIAKIIVDTVYDEIMTRVREYGDVPMGGNLGNINKQWFGSKTDIECSDWATNIEGEVKKNLYDFYKKNINTFKMEWRRMEPFIIFSEHNWIEIEGPRGRVVIDPWRSGGKKIIPQVPSGPGKVMDWHPKIIR